MQQELEQHRDLLQILFAKQASDAAVSEWIGAGASLQTLEPYYRFLAAFDVRGDLPNIQAPTLIIHGQEDQVIAPKELEPFRQMPHGKVKEYAGHGHFIPLTAARRFSDNLLTFLAVHSAPLLVAGNPTD